LFLTTKVTSEILQSERLNWNDHISLPLNEKLLLVNLKVNEIFPWPNELSAGINKLNFNTSFLIQPDVFVRVRPGKLEVLNKKLYAAQIGFKQIGEYCLAVENGTMLENVIDINKEGVIQDLNSQRVGELLPVNDVGMSAKVWDCCAASGGKSIMAYDLIPGIHLTVSDVRQTIIQNLHSRFKSARVTNYDYFVADLTDAKDLHCLKNKFFDLIICDAPCSGSGTWSRTPEQLLFFKPEEIIRYSSLQKRIAANAVSYLNKGGYFLYITCSVFKKENEEVAEFIESQTGLILLKMELLKGYDLKADTMFAALFKLT
ncbi:MAG: methyltransferase domain-containing protein, partial [Bacteroidota bacterium]|nr:methyltransferase domain-containing protein [Bacteroidota bacterium]